MAAGEKPARRKLVTTYYDTKDRALAKRGCVLRVRKHDGRFVQTVKSDGAAGDSPLARGEWEDAVPGETPDPQAGASGAFLTPDIAGRLAPLFRTEVTRTVAEFAPSPGTRIEAAIDRGEIRARGRKSVEPISEVELELKSGPVTSLYDAALQLLAIAPVRLDPRSKAERGYRLAGANGVFGQLVRTDPVALGAEMTAEEALQRFGRSCLAHILRHEAGALAGRVDGVHQVRVGARRLRAVLSAFRPLLPRKQRAWAQDQLRRLAETLSEVRNLDVFAESLIGTAKLAETRRRRLTAVVRRRRRAAHAKARLLIGSARFTGLMLELMRWFDGCGWREDGEDERLRQPVGAVASDLLERRLHAVAKAAHDFANQSPGQRHRLRIAVKKLRYTAELLGALYVPTAVREFIEPLRRLQDDLGHGNDVEVAQQIVAALAVQDEASGKVAETGQRVLDWHRQRLARRVAKTAGRLDRLLTADPFWHG